MSQAGEPSKTSEKKKSTSATANTKWPFQDGKDPAEPGNEGMWLTSTEESPAIQYLQASKIPRRIFPGKKSPQPQSAVMEEIPDKGATGSSCK